MQPGAFDVLDHAIRTAPTLRVSLGIEPQFLLPVNIERHAESLLAARPEPTLSTADRVRRIVAGALAEGEVTLAGVASMLKMSERSLQRRLADEGLKFDALLDEIRRDLALRYLADPKIAIAEVAYLLGYSEPSPFHRAFKRWTGKTPTEARKQAA